MGKMMKVTGSDVVEIKVEIKWRGWDGMKWESSKIGYLHI